MRRLITILAAILALAVLAAASSAWLHVTPSSALPAANSRSSCGVERWSVKTLQDAAGRNIDLTTVKKTTVNKLRSLPVQRGPGSSRGQGVESTVYEVPARLVEAKVEEDDDIHLVIKGVTTAGMMIVEFPTVACSSNATTGAKTRMKDARNAFVAACGMPGKSSFRRLNGKATIRGVAFFDFIHGQRGVAPNGIELHPVLGFSVTTCTA